MACELCGLCELCELCGLDVLCWSFVNMSPMLGIREVLYAMYDV